MVIQAIQALLCFQ